jgi:signal transduction histidine kinase
VLKRVFLIRSIKGKLTALMMIVTAIVLLLVTLAFVVNEAVTFRKAILGELQALTNIVGLNTTAAITFGDRHSAETTLAALAARPNLTAAYILTPDGAVFAKYLPREASGESMLFFEGNGQQQLRDNRAALAAFEHEAHRMWEWDNDLEVVERVMLDDQEVGAVVIRSDLRELFGRLKWFFVLVLIITVIALGIAFLLSGMMHRPISGPILDLAKTMKRISEDKEYTLRAPKRSSDEIGQLIDGFNEMLEQIQKRDEAIERTAAELKQSNDDIKGFIYGAAHDLRQPLVNIKGFTDEMVYALREIQSILQGSSLAPSEKDRDKITAIFQNDILEASGFIGSSVERMSGLINALLKLSQVGHRELRPEPIDMTGLTRSVLDGLEHQIRKNDVNVIVGDLPGVTADRMAMEQIISNLVDNAVKYLSRERPGRVEISGERVGDETIYHVRDNGRGIHAEDTPRLFQLFRRLGTQDVPGEGVGLAYVKALVRRHGGRIWCDSEPGAGSTFSFLIPQDQRPAQSLRQKV